MTQTKYGRECFGFLRGLLNAATSIETEIQPQPFLATRPVFRQQGPSEILPLSLDTQIYRAEARALGSGARRHFVGLNSICTTDFVKLYFCRYDGPALFHQDG